MPILPQASSAAGRVDAVFFFTVALCSVFLIFITLAMIYFAVKYNKKRHPRGEDIEGNTWLEFFWTAIPLVLFIVMFLYGWTNFSYMREVPREAMVIEVTGRQWAWSFKYPNGKRTSELFLAVDKPVKLELRSLDVIHGFFIPAFRIKEDVVPGKDNYTWFVPTQLGSYDIECTVICGVSHATMLSKAMVTPVSDFEKWYFGAEAAPPPGGKKAGNPAATVSNQEAFNILIRKSCSACHSIDGSILLGPSLKGLYGKKEIVRDANGKEKEVVVDEAYLERKITDPAAETAKGYPPAMPKTPMTAYEIKQTIAFIKSLK
jgi:cytochrome c oxidase subunit II